MRQARWDADPKVEQRHGMFRDSLAGWANDDVLQTEAARAALGAKHPAALRVLDWPELRGLFAVYDPPATRHGRSDRRLGVLSVGVATLGLLLAIASPLVIGAERVIEMAAVAVALTGLALMGVYRLGAGSKARSLAHRFGAERVRALYFQAVVNNLDLAARAMADDAALGVWTSARAQMLSDLPKPEDLPGQVPKLAEPAFDDAETWVSPAWSTSPDPPEPSPQLTVLLSLLRGQRLEGQINYLQRKLSDSLGAPGQRAGLVRGLGRLLLGAAAVTGLMAAVLVIAMGRKLGGADVRLALEVTVGAVVASVALGVVNDDQLLAGDAKRYAAYFAALSKAVFRFDTGGPAQKLAALREVEIICYRDLREFVGSHWRSR
jgi:hypothetical protein